jgi:D-3-phosphoglycerate dehydrogenase
VSGGTVVVTSRSFATEDAAPQRDLAGAGLEVVRADAHHAGAELRDALAHCVAWIAGTARVDDDLLALAPSLRVVARYGVGVDGVDVPSATRRGIWVTNTPGANTDAVADLTVALALDALRHVTACASAVGRGDWNPRRGRELGAATVGVVGFGRIGRAVARRLRGFGTTVLAHDPLLDAPCIGEVPLVPLDELVRRSDIVSLHAPGGSVRLDEEWLARLRPGVVLVNTARSELVDEVALAAALRAGRVASYACDTLAAEHTPDCSSPLLAADLVDRVLVTPHLGAQTAESVARMSEMAVRNVLAVLRGGQPPHAVNDPGVTT